MDLSSSPLSAALRGVKAETNALIAQRNYLAVRDLRERCAAEVAEQKQIEIDAAMGQQQIERARLARAHSVMVKRTREIAQHQALRHAEQFATRSASHAARQRTGLQQFEQAAVARESKRPLVYSSTVRDLLQAEEHLVKLHQYEDAAFAKRKIGSTARSEKRTFEEGKRARVRALVDQRQRVLNDAADYMEARRRNEVSMAERRAAQLEALIHKRFEMAADEMAHAHRISLRQNPLVKAVQCPPAMRWRRELASRGEASPVGGIAAAASRGTQFLKAAVGSRYEAPSLCDAYAHLLTRAAELPPCAVSSESVA